MRQHILGALTAVAGAAILASSTSSLSISEMGRATGLVGGEALVTLAQVHPWSPAQPDLYDATVTLVQGEVVLGGRVQGGHGLGDLGRCLEGDALHGSA